MELVHELPFLAKQQLLAAAGPAAIPTSDAPLRTLKRHAVVSNGLDLRLRVANVGLLVGGLQVYCSLNRDAIRLSRMGQPGAAARLAKEAGRIERGAPARRLKALLEKTPVAVAPVAPWQAYIHAIQGGAVRSCAIQVAEAIAGVRAKVRELEESRSTLTGFIIELGETVASVESETGNVIQVPRRTLAELGWDRVGAAVAVHVEHHHQFLLWEIEPALSTKADVAIDPFDYEWPASDALTARIEDLLSGSGTIPLTPAAD